jgi:photosystem II stability/assembly factor-like uncharacterized protein
MSYLYDIHMVSPHKGWAVGSEGRILEYDGGRWTELPSPIRSRVERDLKNHTYPPSFSAIHMVAPDCGWIVGTAALLSYRKEQWTIDSDFDPGGDVSAVCGLTPSDSWCVGRHLFHFDGRGWTRVVPMMTPRRPLDGLSMVAPNEAWFIGSYVWPPSERDPVTGRREPAGAQGYLVHYKDGAWIEAHNPAPDERLNDIQMISSREGWAVTGHGKILRYADSAWQIESAHDGLVLSAVHMLSNTLGWAVDVREGAILHYDGHRWQRMQSPERQTLYSLHMTSSSDGWAVGATSRDLPLGILRMELGKWRV